MVQPTISRLDENYRENRKFPSVLLHKAFFTPWRIIHEGTTHFVDLLTFAAEMMISAWHFRVFLNPAGGLDPVLRGLVGRKAKLNTQEHMMHDELRDRLFKFSSELALDLAALNLQRGRDHGLPGTQWLTFNRYRHDLFPCCHGHQSSTAPFLRLQQMAQVLRAVATTQPFGVSCSNEQHGHGGQAAEPLQDTWQHRRVAGRSSWALCSQGKGRTLIRLLDFHPVPEDSPRRPVLYMTLIRCLMFWSYLCYDYIPIDLITLSLITLRMWWENPGVFTEAQRASLRDTSLARIICDNTNITEVPKQPFLYRPRGSGYKKCSEIPAFNLAPWKDGEFVPKSPVWWDHLMGLCQPSALSDLSQVQKGKQQVKMLQKHFRY